MRWMMIVILSSAPMPLVSWHDSNEACQERAGVEMAYAALRGARVDYVRCERRFVPVFRPVTGEVLG